MKRVKQFSIDILIDDTDGKNETVLENEIAESLEREEYNVLGIDLKCDVSDWYKDVVGGEHFADDIDKMYDFVRISKEEFLKTYSYLTDADYEATVDYYIEHKDDTQRTKEVYEFIRQFIRK